MFDYSRIDIPYPYLLHWILVYVSKFFFSLTDLFDYNPIMHENVVSPVSLVPAVKQQVQRADLFAQLIFTDARDCLQLWFGLFILIMLFVSVSYTHLDVYKRQSIRFVNTRLKRENRCAYSSNCTFGNVRKICCLM